ncbi:MAG: uracil phosphoribosyltransferase [Candidatus Methylacidiphilales bacterium]
MMLVNLSENNSIVQHFLDQIRDKEIQKDSLRFRKNLFRIAQIIAYEASKQLNYATKNIETPITNTSVNVINNQPIICSILRAGLVMHEGFLDFFDQSDSAFVSAYRKHSAPGEFEIVVEYMASPSLQDKTVILVDPMLATGRSMYLAYQAICKHGVPAKVIIATLIASEQGLVYINRFMPKANIITAAIDSDLNENSYIVPGLGDAGDLAYGIKL